MKEIERLNSKLVRNTYKFVKKAHGRFSVIFINKLHWVITGKTAAQLIAERADATKPNMGLTTWKDAKVRKSDVTVAKNYLNETEIR